MPTSIVVLAAGKGKRMCSALPKVLHPVGGRPMLDHVLDTARQLDPEQLIVVYGHGGEAVRTVLAENADILWVEQNPQLGTGHAVQQCISIIPPDNDVLVLYGDVPLIRHDTLKLLLKVRANQRGVALLTLTLSDPSGYGRILRDDNGVIVGIVEQRDATIEQSSITEVNTGVICTNAGQLSAWLSRLNNNNAQQEYYLTDCIAMAFTEGQKVTAVNCYDANEVLGVNDKLQLSVVERSYQLRQARELMLNGVTLIDPNRLEIRGEVEVGQDVVIDINVILAGQVKIGNQVNIGANCIVIDSELGDGVNVLPNSLVEGGKIATNCRIGPFARIRPETILDQSVHIGNFVEVKKSSIGAGSKVNHLSYIGDSEIGNRVNVGAGTITCNYDGANKHRTYIGDDAFIGSDTQLIAPVSVGAGATIGAGSTITRDSPSGQLTLSRVKQVTIANWVRPTKKIVK